jgi:hypothetical protein
MSLNVSKYWGVYVLYRKFGIPELRRRLARSDVSNKHHLRVLTIINITSCCICHILHARHDTRCIVAKRNPTGVTSALQAQSRACCTDGFLFVAFDLALAALKCQRPDDAVFVCETRDHHTVQQPDFVRGAFRPECGSLTISARWCKVYMHQFR